MRSRSLPYLFLPAMLLLSCSRNAPHIAVVCEENNVGNCIIKWEIKPSVKGKVKVYASTRPDFIPEQTPVAMTDIADQRLTVITTDPVRRYYYTLVFDGKYRVKVATRNINIPGIQNFRDLGGYPSYSTKKTVRWGMLYRSAEIDSLEQTSLNELRNIGVKTIVDLRSPAEASRKAPLQEGFNVVRIPIATGDMEQLLQEVRQQKIKTDTVYRIVERMNRLLTTQYTEEFRRVFRLLLDRRNYPLVIHCSSGKGRTGIAAALILAALGVDEDTIMEDYRLSNDFFNIPAASQYAYRLPARSQEAITTVFSARKDFLNAAKDEVQKRYGSVGAYLQKAIGLTKEEIHTLRDILLTDNNRR